MLGYSRAMVLTFAPDQRLETLLRCHQAAFEALGGVPREILYDRMKTVILGVDERGEVRWHPQFLDLAQHWGLSAPPVGDTVKTHGRSGMHPKVCDEAPFRGTGGSRLPPIAEWFLPLPRPSRARAVDRYRISADRRAESSSALTLPGSVQPSAALRPFCILGELA